LLRECSQKAKEGELHMNKIRSVLTEKKSFWSH